MIKFKMLSKKEIMNIGLLIISNIISISYFIYFLININSNKDNLTEFNLEISAWYFMFFFVFNTTYIILYILFSLSKFRSKNLPESVPQKKNKNYYISFTLYLVFIGLNIYCAYTFYSDVSAFRDINYLSGFLYYIIEYIKYFVIGVFFLGIFLIIGLLLIKLKNTQ